MRPDISLAPIDCGFDPRVHKMVCVIPAGGQCVRYQVLGGYEVKDAVGSLPQIVATLRRHGYRVRIARRGEEE